MGMFDELRCRYPLPVEGANDLCYQTKDLECMLDAYEIRDDGTLWRDASHAHADEARHKRWEQVVITGEVTFYDLLLEPGQDLNDRSRHSGWIEWSSYFVNGTLAQLHLVRHELPGPISDSPSAEAESAHGVAIS